MQELIEYLRSLAFSKCHLGMGDIMLTQGHIDELEEKYIQKEKEHIIDAYCSGYQEGSIGDAIQSDEYFYKTYNQYK